MPGPKTSGGDFERKVDELFGDHEEERPRQDELSEPLEETREE